jgi:leader peptidase (prepilin peptidase)/N-methyltransferase
MILKGMFFSSLLMAASYTDIKKRVIPDAIPMLIALISLLNFKLTNQFGIVIGLPFLIAAVLVEDSIGGGDIKLTAWYLDFGREYMA